MHACNCHLLEHLTMLKNFLPSVILISLPLVAIAQSTPFTGFTSGNLVVTRTVYAADVTTVAVGQPLPPVCPATAKCGSATATNTGAYPGVWNNVKADGNFGITTPIFLDQITPAGTLVNTLAVPPTLMVTSFSSKSEFALNLSTDGTVLTLMGYVAPPNGIDVSNSNTPAVYDPTNPDGNSYFRGVLQISQGGAFQVTPTNAFSGDNGRAVILGSNGLYYMVGNSNNGSGTPANVVASTGVQVATPGQSPATTPIAVGNFSVTQVNDPATGKPYAADKAGKDNNFRGLTIFNNTLYVTKGSGSNGINTVYQVGAAGSLPTLANAASAPFAILSGFPTTLAKNAGALFPFGIWFANANTLYVADEGDGVIADAGTSKTAGLQKWSLVNGTWQLLYVLQNGLNLGKPYSITGYPAALNPATDGLRNITGRVNGDGTVTIWAVTSTISTNGDQGADPNLLMSITDTLANTTAASAATETFTLVKAAAAGEVLRGVAFAPVSGLVGMANVPSVISAANPGAMAIAPGSLATMNGLTFAIGIFRASTNPPPTSLGGASVSVVDAMGKTYPAPLLYVSPNQINFEVPAGVATGTAQVTVSLSDGTRQTASMPVAAIAPGVFTLNNVSLAAAVAVRVSSDATQTVQQVYSLNSAGAIVANPINMGSTNDRVYLSLFGTGLQAAGTGGVAATAGGVNAQVFYAGPQGGFAGLDQVNILLPASLAGKGNVNIQLTAGGIAANPVEVTIQ